MEKAIQVLAVGVLLLVQLPGLAWASPGKPPKARDLVYEMCASPTWAKKVVSFQQGPLLDGEPVPAERSDPGQALGSPDDAFVSLGFDGSITVAFKRPIFNRPGPNDLFILVKETTWFYASEDYPTETANVYLIIDGDEVLAGEVTSRDGENTGLGIVTIPDSIRHIRAVRIEDATEPDPFWQFPSWTNADAFDLDAVGTCSSHAN